MIQGSGNFQFYTRAHEAAVDLADAMELKNGWKSHNFLLFYETNNI